MAASRPVTRQLLETSGVQGYQCRGCQTADEIGSIETQLLILTTVNVVNDQCHAYQYILEWMNLNWEIRSETTPKNVEYECNECSVKFGCDWYKE